MEKKKITLVLIGMITLVVGFLIGFSITLGIKNSQQQFGTIYLMPSEIESAPVLKDNLGVNVVVVGLLGETIENIIPQGNVQDIVNSEEIRW